MKIDIRRCRQAPTKEYFIASIHFDTSENEAFDRSGQSAWRIKVEDEEKQQPAFRSTVGFVNETLIEN